MSDWEYVDFCIQTKVIKPHKVIFPVCTCKMYMSVCGLYGLSAAHCWLWYDDDDDDDDERRLLLTDSALVSVLVARPEEETEKEKSQWSWQNFIQWDWAVRKTCKEDETVRNVAQTACKVSNAKLSFYATGW